MLAYPFTILKKILAAGFLLALVWPPSTGEARDPGRLGRVNVEALNFRDQPSINGKPLKLLKRGDEVLIVEEAAGWIKVVHMDQIGYIKGEKGYLEEKAVQKDKDLGGLLKTSKDLDLRLEKSRKAIREISKDERKTVLELQKIDGALNQVKGTIRSTSKKVEALDGKIRETEARLAEADKKINVQKDSADKRMVALYKMHRLGAISLFASAENVFDMAKYKNSFERILEKDARQISDYANTRRRYHELLEVQKKQQMEQERFQKELTEQEQAVALEKGKRDRLLAEVREQKRLELASLEMLKEDALALDRKLISYAKAVSKREEPRPSVYVDKPARKTAVEPLEPEPAKPSARISKESAPEGRRAEKTGKDFTGQERFDRLKGLLKMPVKGKVVNRFGSYHNPEYNITNFRSGIDIKARQGEPILAVHSGKVLYAEWFKGYGNMIILDHGNHYYTVYANIEELYKKTGDHVDRHETIATVGDTGSVMGPKLYFEIRHFGKPLNPMKWIQAG